MPKTNLKMDHENLLDYLDTLHAAERQLTEAERDLRRAKERVSGKVRDILAQWRRAERLGQVVGLVSENPENDTWKLVCQAVSCLMY